MLIRKACFREIRGFDEDLSAQEDHDLWLRIIKKGYKIGYIDKPFMTYRTHNESLTAYETETFMTNKIKVMKKLLNPYSDLSGKTKRIIYKKLASYYWRAGYFNFSRNRLERARTWFREGLKFRITRPLVFYLIFTFIPECYIERIRKLKAILRDVKSRIIPTPKR